MHIMRTYRFWSTFARPPEQPPLLIPATQRNHPSSWRSAHSRAVLSCNAVYILYSDNILRWLARLNWFDAEIKIHIFHHVIISA